MVKWFSARCFSGVLHYTQNSQQRTYTHRPVNSEPPKITHRHSSARQKGGQHQHAHAAAKNTNPHKASGVPASHGESHGIRAVDPWLGISMGNQLSGNFLDRFQLWSERYHNTGNFPGYYPPRKKRNNLGTTKKPW